MNYLQNFTDHVQIVGALWFLTILTATNYARHTISQLSVKALLRNKN
jgi:hypothetical protein